MRHISAALALGLVLALNSTADAQTVTSKSVACSSKVRLQSAIDALAVGAIGRFTVTGNCVENIYVPLGKEVELIGGANVAITAKDPNKAALTVKGSALVEKFTITAAGTPYGAVEVARGGFLHSIASTISAPQTLGVAAYENSYVAIMNNRISGGVFGEEGTVLWIAAGTNRTLHPLDGAKLTVSNSRGAAIACADSGALHVIARNDASGQGSVLLQNSLGGVWSTCQTNLNNRTRDLSKFVITGLTSGTGQPAAIDIGRGESDISFVKVVSNATDGLRVGGKARITGSLFQSNSGTDLYAGAGGFITFEGDQSSLADAMTPNNYDVSCDAGSRIQYSSASLAQPLLPSYDYLGQCLSIVD